MATEIKTKDGYAGAFSELMQRSAGEPAWLRALREKSFAQFERTGLPAVTEEDWKYTNVAAIAKGEFAPVIQTNGTALTVRSAGAFAYDETRGSRFVFINGILRKDLSATSALPSQIIALDLSAAAQQPEHESVISRVIKREAEDGFVALNTAFFAGGLFLKIPQGIVVESPIQLVFISEPQGTDTPEANFSRVVIEAESGSAATIIESYTSQQAGAYLTNAIIDFVIDDDARITHYKIQRESVEAYHVAVTRADMGRSSRFETTSVNLGAALSRHNIDVRMDHEGAECSVDGLYMVEGSQHTDTHSVIDHRQPHCTSHQLYKGILDGKSRAVFNGKVFVRHGAQQTDARQTNKNLLLSDTAQVDTKPQLEIYADDVKCTHGAAIGQLDEEEIFYLESRGINPGLARNLLTYGFAEEVIDKIKIESIKRELDVVVLNRLHSELAIDA